MSDLSALLEEKAFWLYYTYVSQDPLGDEVLRHCGTTVINGCKYPQAAFLLPCGENYELVVTVTPSVGYDINLGLWNSETDAVAEMGWWDEARSHPYALRWEELNLLHDYWIEHLEPSIDPSAAFLLLAGFVGIGVDGLYRLSEYKTEIRRHYERLDLFSDTEITSLTDTFRPPREEDYHWTQDDNLGWVFGGKYPCYSLRNPQHADGQEGRFPFSSWAQVIEKLSLRRR